MKYYVFGQQIWESTGTADRDEAERILRETVQQASGVIPISALHALHKKALRTYLALEDDKKERFRLALKEIYRAIRRVHDFLDILAKNEGVIHGSESQRER